MKVSSDLGSLLAMLHVLQISIRARLIGTRAARDGNLTKHALDMAALSAKALPPP